MILRQAEPTHAPHALEPLSLETMMNNMNPNQTKVTTTAFAEGEEHVLSAEQAELLFGGGTIFRVQAPGPLKSRAVDKLIYRR